MTNAYQNLKWWCTPVTQSLWEVGAGRLKNQGQPGLLGETAGKHPKTK